MYYFPLVDLIEKGIEWAKKRGSRIYWLWMIVSGFLGALFLNVWSVQGFNEACPILAIFLFIYLVGMYPVWLYEKHREEKSQ